MNRRSWGFVLVVTLAVVLGFSQQALAAQENTAWQKLERGVINTTTGWLELAVQPVKGAHGEEPFLGTVAGFGRGLLLGLQRTGIGLADGLSFPVAPYNRPVMEPETLFSES